MRWKKIGKYHLISDEGKVKVLARKSKDGRNLKESIVKTQYDSAGYERIVINSKTYRIHCLVAMAFLPNPNKHKHVKHITSDIHNNHPSNLIWVNKYTKNIYRDKSMGYLFPHKPRRKPSIKTIPYK